MRRAVTLHTIADACGCHYSTVSLALRGDQRISEKTREHVRKTADALGYRPDPMLKALSVYRQSLRPENYRATLAWITSGRQPQMHEPGYIFRGYVEGAQARGRELGYRLEEFARGAPGMTPQRLEKILASRGIDGLLVAPLPGPRTYGRIMLDWSQFHAVTFGYSLAWPSLHRVATNHGAGARLAVRKLLSLGYRRIGLVIDRVASGRVDGNWLGGYLSYVVTRQMEPLVFLREGTGSHKVLLAKRDSERLLQWIRESKVDSLIFDYSPPFVEWLRRDCGLRVPEDLGVASLNVGREDQVHSGIAQNEWEIGWYAMDTLVNMINSHERGIPTVPHNLLMEGIWRPGQTVQRITAHSPRPKVLY